MRKFILAALLALPLTALVQSRAAAGDDCCCCCSPTITCNFGFKLKTWGCFGISCNDCCNHCCNSCCGGCGGCGCAPWYSYWPYDAHFQTPAPTGYPYWPSAQGPMMYGSPACASNYGPPPPAMALPAPAPMPYSAPAVQPCGYTPSQAPSYWYSH